MAVFSFLMGISLAAAGLDTGNNAFFISGNIWVVAGFILKRMDKWNS